jgi:KipI family sensor histidine kinase inhibitor
MRLLPAGEQAVLVEVASSDAVAELYALLRAATAAGELRAEEIVPAARTVLIDGVDVARATAVLEALRSRRAPEPEGGRGDGGRRTVDVPTRYDGPDLDDVARLWDMTRREAVRTHSGTDFVVAFCGFAPGFAYCTGLAPARAVSRLATPRPRVPAGSVGLAGEFTGVYPTSSPGGWRLIGRTDLVLWTPEADPPATLAPGTKVRFTVVDG